MQELARDDHSDREAGAGEDRVAQEVGRRTDDDDPARAEPPYEKDQPCHDSDLGELADRHGGPDLAVPQS